MVIRFRAATVVVAALALMAMGAPGVAQAHHGRGQSGRRFASGHGDAPGGRQAQSVQFLCAEDGVPLNGHAYQIAHAPRPDQSPSGLTETQNKELMSACEKLAAAAAVRRTADQAASKTSWEAVKAAAAKLDEACPALTEHHLPGSPPSELSPACKEALKSFWTAVHEAHATDRAAIEAAAKPYDEALAEFETATAAIVASLDAPQTQHIYHQGAHGATGMQGGCPGH
jgi:hypothetical protein